MLYVLITHSSDIAEEEASLNDLVVNGTNLLSAVEDVLTCIDSLKSIAGEYVMASYRI